MTQPAAAHNGVAYLPLIHLEARCEYFESGLCRDLQYVLTSASAALVRNRALLVRSTPAGVTVYTATRGEPAKTAASNEALDLTFKVVTGDTGFACYAELDGRQMDTVFRFDSANATPNAADSALRLHSESWAGAADRIPVSSPELNGVLDAKERLAPPLAVVTLHLNASDLTGATGARHYYIAFQARRTLWKYYVLGAAQTDAELSIRDTEGTIEFAAAPGSPERICDNRQAVALLSKGPIALQERSNLRFQLRVNTPEGGKVLVKRLAVASPHQFAKEIVNGREVAVSEIYINL